MSKQSSSKSPSSRTYERLRELGATYQKVEQFVKLPGGAGFRRDLFGCIDIVALMEGAIVGIQATDSSNHSKRVAKALQAPNLVTWLQHGGRFQVWSWGKSTSGKWVERIQEIRIPAKELKAAGVVAILHEDVSL
jgi:hypothetical protein